jgi:hypothetical protein
MKAILVFSHEHNTFDKRKMLINPHPDYLKDSPKTVDDFIRMKDEEPIKEFFMKKIDKLLASYEPGEPKMKPDVLAQIKVIEAERAEMMRKAQEEMAAKNSTGPIILQRPGEEPKELSQQEVVGIMQQQQAYIGVLINKIQELEKIVVEVQTQLIEAEYKLTQATRTEESVREENIEIKIVEPEVVKKGPLVTVEGD